MTTTANSTPTGFPKFDTNAISSSVPTNTVQSPVMSPAPYSSQAPVTPTVTGPSVGSIAPPSPDITTLYNPTNGTTTQKQADATYTDKLLSAVSSTGSVPSTDITKGTSFTTAGAKRSANETALQQYLDQQKAFQDKYLAAIQPTAEETALQKRVNELKTQAGLNQEQALLSGETSSFAGGEAQRVARTDALKLAGAAEALQALQGQRENTLKQLQYLQSTNDGSFKTQLEIQKLQNEVSGIDKQAQDTFFNLQQSNPDVPYNYDATKTPTENLNEFRKLVAAKPTELSAANRQSRITSIVGQYDNEPVVKEYNTIAQQVETIKNAGKTPTDDIQRIYAFAKVMDPGSAVREGEYGTIQKYSTALLERAGLNAKRIVWNEGFLTDESRKFILDTLNNRLATSEKSFKNITSQYNKKIEEAKSGDVGGSVVDYSGGYTSSIKPTSGTIVKTKVGDINTDW